MSGLLHRKCRHTEVNKTNASFTFVFTCTTRYSGISNSPVLFNYNAKSHYYIWNVVFGPWSNYCIIIQFCFSVLYLRSTAFKSLKNTLVTKGAKSHLKMSFAWRPNAPKDDYSITLITIHPTTHNTLARPLLYSHTLALVLSLRL